MPALEPGAHAPDFELLDLDGHPRKLSEIGKSDLLLLAFYHSACPTCRFAMPFVGVMSRELQTSTTKIWGISQDDEDESTIFAREAGLQMPILIDAPAFSTSAAYGVTNVPTLFVIDLKLPGSHKIVTNCVGFSRADFDEIARTLAERGDRPIPDLYNGQGVPELRPG